ncbi:MAG TPA: alpha/beta fold hydrolase, partial [Bacilli bacterium]|nr:alpha/beta fold hydrolase [Bacilli bacterium]
MENYSHKYKISPELTLYGAYWGVKKPRANVLVITGMQEHAMRYTEFAKFLNEAEFSVYSIDYFGQGENVTQGGHTLGVLPNHGFEKFVTALGTFVENLAKDKLPLYVLGHSMGSFLAQRFVQRYPLLSKKVV